LEYDFRFWPNVYRTDATEGTRLIGTLWSGWASIHADEFLRVNSITEVVQDRLHRLECETSIFTSHITTKSTPTSTSAAMTQTPGPKPSTSAAQPPPIPEVPKICSTASRLENMWTASSVRKDAQSRLASAVAAKAPEPTLKCLASLTSLYNAAWPSDLRYCATASKTDTSRCSKEIQRRTDWPRR
jgi:hypothetical protein